MMGYNYMFGSKSVVQNVLVNYEIINENEL